MGIPVFISLQSSQHFRYSFFFFGKGKEEIFGIRCNQKSKFTQSFWCRVTFFHSRVTWRRRRPNNSSRQGKDGMSSEKQVPFLVEQGPRNATNVRHNWPTNPEKGNHGT